MKNILFILADCLRSDAVFGVNRRTPTPALDDLKRRGTSFTQMISSASMTSPCVASLFTGCYPHVSGVHALRGDVLNPMLPTLAELLNAQGYHTAGLMTGPLWRGLGVERGFETYDYRKPSPGLSEAWRECILKLGEQGGSSHPWFIYAHFFDLHAPRVIASDMNHAEYGSTVYERALASFDRRLGEILAGVDWDKTIVVFHADHGELFPQTAWLETRERIWQDFILGNKPPFMRIGIKRDPTVKLWTKLKRLTKMGHGFNLSEGLVRVPLIVTGVDQARVGQTPQVPGGGGIVTAQARQVDIMPTLLQLAGIEPPSALSGRSLIPLINGIEKGTRPAYMEARAFGRDPTFFMRGIRTPDWKFVDSPSDPRVKPQLYSLTVDPLEKRNVVGDHPQIVGEMKRLLQQETTTVSPRGEVENWTEEETRLVEERLRSLGYF